MSEPTKYIRKLFSIPLLGLRDRRGLGDLLSRLRVLSR